MCTSVLKTNYNICLYLSIKNAKWKQSTRKMRIKKTKLKAQIWILQKCNTLHYNCVMVNISSWNVQAIFWIFERPQGRSWAGEVAWGVSEGRACRPLPTEAGGCKKEREKKEEKSQLTGCSQHTARQHQTPTPPCPATQRTATLGDNNNMYNSETAASRPAPVMGACFVHTKKCFKNN